ncbi:MAG: hypothetical protein E6J29_14310, partial [Chloroflexi bacterium]
VCFGDWTCELCGGTHVRSSAEVGLVLIRSERSVSSGVRRLDLVAGEAAEDELERREGAAAAARADLERRLHEAQKRIERLEEELRNAQLKGGSVEARQRARAWTTSAPSPTASSSGRAAGGWWRSPTPPATWSSPATARSTSSWWAPRWAAGEGPGTSCRGGSRTRPRRRSRRSRGRSSNGQVQARQAP